MAVARPPRAVAFVCLFRGCETSRILLFEPLLFIMLMWSAMCLRSLLLSVVSVTRLLRILVLARLLKQLMAVFLSSVLRVRLFSPLGDRMCFIHIFFASVLGLGSFFQIDWLSMATFQRFRTQARLRDFLKHFVQFKIAK